MERGRILLVDDEPAALRAYAEKLGRAGFTVTKSTGGAEAAAILERAPDAFDAVLTDLVMPMMNGLALVQRVRSLRPELPVLLMSDKADNEVAVDALEQGVLCLVKPVATDALTRALETSIRRLREFIAFRWTRTEPPREPGASVTATQAKNEFAQLLESSMNAPVYITKHEKPKAVLLSFERYLELSRSGRRRLDSLSEEFDALYQKMQQPESRQRMRAAFEASPEELGRAAVAAARKRSK
jgi:antitoxin Phd